ncbi:MAG: hypothetical protein AB9897_03060 [Anaerolineaceae bacterium]
MRKLNKSWLLPNPAKNEWLMVCAEKKKAWQAFKAQAYAYTHFARRLLGQTSLTQPAAIKMATDWAKDAGCRVSL